MDRLIKGISNHGFSRAVFNGDEASVDEILDPIIANLNMSC